MSTFQAFSKLLATIIVSLISIGSIAQAPIITYPSPAKSITRGYSSDLLTVRLVFNGVCTGATTVKVAFPESVTYVASSVVKIAGATGVGINESSIGDLRNPVFNISGISAVGDELVFTVARSASCGTLATAKDSIYVFSSGGCSDIAEIAGTVNTYNLFAPALAITPNAALTGMILGSTATRTTTVVNGGNGATDTLRFYIVYPNAGIENTTGTNTIVANSVSFSPTTISGDTLFYKIFGATIFGGDNELTNGETVIISEPIKIKKCDVTTTYGAGWGNDNANVCQWANATSVVSMATGVPDFTAVSGLRGTYIDKCTPHDYTLTMTNGGTGNVVAATMYDVRVTQGQTSGAAGGLVSYDTSIMSLSNFRIGTTAIPATNVSWTGGLVTVNFNNLFATDPDGVGVGLDDIDGDGFYDDLPSGKSVSTTNTLSFKCDLPCGRDIVIWPGTGVTMTYRLMCGTSFITSDKRHSGINLLYEAAFDGVGYIPANVIGGQPFRFQAKAAFYINSSSFDNANTRYRWKIALTPGFGVSGGGAATYGTASATYITISGGASGVDTLVYTSSSPSLDSFNIDLVYTCGVGGAKSIYYALEKINNIATGCFCQSKKFCKTISTTTFCPSPCAAGPSNFIPQVRRADSSLGWTDYTLSTRQVASAISNYDLSKALYLDTIQVICTAIQNNPSSNLHLELTLPKTTSGVNKLNPIKVVSSYYNAGGLIGTSTVTDAVVSTLASTASMQSIDWTLNIPVPGGSLLVGDSIYSVAYYVVATNELPTNDIQSGARNIYFNLNLSGGRDYCFDPVPEMYLVGTILTNSHNGYSTTGCTPNSLGGSTNYLARRFNTSGVLFQNEFRPVMYVDSVVATVPTGYDFVSSAFQPQTGGPAYTITPSSVVGNVYKFVNPGPGGSFWTPLGLTVTNTYGGYVPFTVVPNCATVSGENINFKVYIRDYYYAYAGNPTPPGLAYEISAPSTGAGKTLGIGYSTSNKPDIIISDQTGVVQGLVSSQSWTIRMSSVGLSAAPYTWLAIPTNVSINIIQLTDVATGTPVPAISYPGGTWYQLSTTGIASGMYNDYKIDFSYTACAMDSLKVLAGWNCSSFPANPTAYICGSDSLFLKIDPQPSQVQLSIARQPGAGSAINLCVADSVLLLVNSAQAGNLIQPYINFFPPTGITLITPIKIEYPLGSGDYQNATVSSIAGGGFKIDLSAHTGIGSNGLLGTSSSSPTFVPLGGDRQMKIKLEFTTDCGFASGTSFRFNAYGSRPCGTFAIGNAISATTMPLNIIGASAPGSAGIAMDFGGVSSLACGSSALTIALTTIPTGIATIMGDTMVYTLPTGLAYAGGLSAGFVADTSGTGGSTIVKIAMPTGVATGTPIVYSFEVLPKGAGCGTAVLTGSFKRLIAPLVCGVGAGAFSCSSSSVVIANGTSPNIALNKPSFSISNVTVLDTTAWRQANWNANHIKVFYRNLGTIDYTANTDTIEFYCGSSLTPFATRPLTKNVPSGGNDSDEYFIMMPIGACSAGDVIRVDIPSLTAAGSSQCLCLAASYSMVGIGLPLQFLNTSATAKDCAVSINWDYNKVDELTSFVIERSSNGSEYKIVSSHKSNVMNCEDITPNAGEWFYRIKAIGYSGEAAYSQTLKVQTSYCQGQKMSIYPNPASELLNIVLQGETNDNSYQIVDAMGRILIKGSLKSNSNNEINVGALVQGVYVLKVLSDENVHTQLVQIEK